MDKPEPTPLRWAIVGPGHIARKFASDLKSVEGAILEAIVSRHPERATEFAAEFGANRVIENEDRLAADPDIDLVYIATPHPAHFSASRRLLLAGKPVLCEKPLCVNAAQAAELISISRERNVFLMEALWSRFLPIYEQVAEWLKEEKIGRPRLVTSTFCVNLPADPSRRWLNPDLAGGALLDLGIYNLAITQMVMPSPPEDVQASAQLSPLTGVDELLSVNLRYPDGALAQFTCGLNSIHENALVIAGDKGFIRVPGRFISPVEATLTLDSESFTVRRPLRAGGLEYEIEEAMRCFRSGFIESPRMPHSHTLQNHETMDRIRQQIGLHYPSESIPL